MRLVVALVAALLAGLVGNTPMTEAVVVVAEGSWYTDTPMVGIQLAGYVAVGMTLAVCEADPQPAGCVVGMYPWLVYYWLGLWRLVHKWLCMNTWGSVLVFVWVSKGGEIAAALLVSWANSDPSFRLSHPSFSFSLSPTATALPR